MTREELEALANVRIASPCPVRWSDMRGDEKRRFCAQCQTHVHKLSELSTREAVALLRAEDTARPCVQVFYRLDGTVMTKDCASAWSVGRSEAQRRFGSQLAAGSLLGAIALFTVAVALMLVTLFGDNLRALLGMSTGGLPGSPTVATRHALPPPPPGKPQ